MGLEGISEELSRSEHLQGIDSLDALAQGFIDLKTADPLGGLEENVRETLNGSEIKDVSTLASKFLEAKDKIPVVPESFDKYQYQWPDGQPLDEADYKIFQQEAHKLGLTQAQFEGIIKYDVGRIGRALEQMESNRKEAISGLVNEKKISEAEIIGKVEKVYKALGLEDLVNRLDLNSDPQFLKTMLSIEENISEDVLLHASTVVDDKQIKRADDGTPVFHYKSMEKKE